MSEHEESVTGARIYVEQLFESRGLSVPALPPCCIIAHSDALIELARQQFECESFDLGSRRRCTVHILRTPAGSFAIAAAGAGAPMTALLVEELLALGVRAFVSAGPGGSLQNGRGGLAPGELVLVGAALPCEGTSRHYGGTGQIERPDAALETALAATLQRYEVPFVRAMTASTDALYRETPSLLRTFAERGAAMLDMEASALFAACRFHHAAAAALLIVSDTLGPSNAWSLALIDERITQAERAVLPALVELACRWS